MITLVLFIPLSILLLVSMVWIHTRQDFVKDWGPFLDEEGSKLCETGMKDIKKDIKYHLISRAIQWSTSIHIPVFLYTSIMFKDTVFPMTLVTCILLELIILYTIVLDAFFHYIFNKLLLMDLISLRQTIKLHVIQLRITWVIYVIILASHVVN